MTARLSPQRETEIRERAESETLTPGPWCLEYEQCDCSDGYCRHGAYVAAVATPEPTPVAAERLARAGEEPRDYDFSRTDMGDFSSADWELMAHAREDVPALLAELAAVRAERDEARAAGGRWWKRAREAEAMVYELKRPSIEKERNEVRSSMTRLTSEAEAEGDHEGVAALARELDKYEAKWRRQDDEMRARIGADSEEASP